ncbi:hypothetical protein [Kitasatospora sp. NPDC087314]
MTLPDWAAHDLLGNLRPTLGEDEPATEFRFLDVDNGPEALPAS